MYLKRKDNGLLVKVVDQTALIDPLKDAVSAQIQAGQEEQPPEEFNKENLLFPSGEKLPQCWVDVNYHKTPTPAA